MFWVLSGEHTDPMKMSTILDNSKVLDGPFWSAKEANQFALSVMQKNIDSYYHRAHVLNNKPTMENNA
jgi:hypothetical protein